MNAPVPPPLAVCFAGGGTFGIAYLLGVAEALVDGGVRLGDLPTIGTSAGSWAAGAVGLGVRWEQAMDILGSKAPRWPDPRPGRLREVATEVFGERRAPNMHAIACALPRVKRTRLAGADHPLADLVAASSAVPGVLAPHRVDGTWYIDGGVRSMASADLAPKAENLLVLAPIAGPMFGPAGRHAERVLSKEVRSWQQTNPAGKYWLIRPNHAIAGLARLPTHLFDLDRAKRCYDLSYAQGMGIVKRWNDDHPGGVEEFNPRPSS